MALDYDASPLAGDEGLRRNPYFDLAVALVGLFMLWVLLLAQGVGVTARIQALSALSAMMVASLILSPAIPVSFFGERFVDARPVEGAGAFSCWILIFVTVMCLVTLIVETARRRQSAGNGRMSEIAALPMLSLFVASLFSGDLEPRALGAPGDQKVGCVRVTGGVAGGEGTDRVFVEQP